MTRLTIIVPTFNSYNILKQLIFSLKSQVFKDWEVLFIDGGSEKDHLKYLDTLINSDKRFKWVFQSKSSKGIYGAMSDGMKLINKDHWIFFMGSDDIFTNKNVLKVLSEELKAEKPIEQKYDVLFCRCRYTKDGIKNRVSSFGLNSYQNIYCSKEINSHLFWGNSPPHQGTIIGPKARKFLSIFSKRYDLAGDLDYIMKISKNKSLKFKSMKMVLSLLASDGISNKETIRRIYEVINIYYKNYNLLFLVPFLLRYFRRLVSKYSY